MAVKPLYGDPANAAPVWSKYAVLLGSLTATNPTTNAAFTLNDGSTTTTQWDPTGSLDDDSPMDNGEESIDATDHSAAGFGVYATTYKNQKETRTFTCKETTLTTLGLSYDTSGLTDAAGVISGTLKRRDPAKRFKIAFHRENGTDIERYISKVHAYIDSVSRSQSDGETLCEVTVVIVPAANGDLFDYYKGAKA